MRNKVFLAAASLALGVLAGCGGAGAQTVASSGTQNGDSAVSQTLAWYANGAHADLSAMETGMNEINTAAHDGSLTELQSACTDMQRAVEQSQAYQSMPDAEGQQDWAASLAAYARAMNDCLDGISSNDPSLIAAAGQEEDAGNTYMLDVDSRLKQLGG